jgi:hypothetical protein
MQHDLELWNLTLLESRTLSSTHVTATIWKACFQKLLKQLW